MEYNISIQWEFLKQAENLEKQEDYLELLSYLVTIEEHFFWQNRHHFFGNEELYQ